jgi:putative membrane protein
MILPMGEQDWWTSGDEPDPRWSLANERTLLAYSRTSLGFLVAGIAVAGSHTAADLPTWFAAVGLPLIATGIALALASRRRFEEAQRAMRNHEPLPRPHMAHLVPLFISLTGVAALVAAAIELAR